MCSGAVIPRDAELSRARLPLQGKFEQSRVQNGSRSHSQGLSSLCGTSRRSYRAKRHDLSLRRSQHGIQQMKPQAVIDAIEEVLGQATAKGNQRGSGGNRAASRRSGHFR